GSEGWARGPGPNPSAAADCSSCSRGESGPPRAGRGTDRERFLRSLPRASNNRLRTGTDKGESDCLIKQSIAMVLADADAM
ncbi:hypothetical protein AAUPMC_21151, partial [Pasteurella multocida subsp. multocida str. Anand1_cattle]